MKVGFIGLGLMGSSMALNVRAAGYDMIVNDLRKEAGAPHVKAGCAWSDEALPDSVEVGRDGRFSRLPGGHARLPEAL